MRIHYFQIFGKVEIGIWNTPPPTGGNNINGRYFVISRSKNEQYVQFPCFRYLLPRRHPAHFE